MKLRTELARQRCGLTKEKFYQELEKLQKAGLVKIFNNKVIDVQFGIQIEYNHLLAPRNHINWRLKSIQHIETNWHSTEDYYSSVVFSATKETKIKIKEVLQKTIIEIQKIVQSCDRSEDVFHFNIDLY